MWAAHFSLHSLTFSINIIQNLTTAFKVSYTVYAMYIIRIVAMSK